MTGELRRYLKREVDKAQRRIRRKDYSILREIRFRKQRQQ